MISRILPCNDIFFHENVGNVIEFYTKINPSCIFRKMRKLEVGEEEEINGVEKTSEKSVYFFFLLWSELAISFLTMFFFFALWRKFLHLVSKSFFAIFRQIDVSHFLMKLSHFCFCNSGC